MQADGTLPKWILAQVCCLSVQNDSSGNASPTVENPNKQGVSVFSNFYIQELLFF